MRNNDRFENLKKRIEIVDSWRNRFEDLFKLKGMNKKSFCDKYELHLAWLSRAMAGQTPHWRCLMDVENGLKKEGVKMHRFAIEFLKKTKSDEDKTNVS